MKILKVKKVLILILNLALIDEILICPTFRLQTPSTLLGVKQMW